MYDPKIEKVTAMFKDLAVKHEGSVFSLTLDWTIMEVSHPAYGKVQQVVPLIDVQYK